MLLWSNGKAPTLTVLLLHPKSGRYTFESDQQHFRGIYMYINGTRAKKTFKKELGQANHFLITILIGLDSIPQFKEENGQLPDIKYSTNWNPKSIESSVARSRHYAIKSSFSWLVDSLDMYLRLLNKKPFLVNGDVRKLLDSERNSVYKRIVRINEEYSINKTYYHLVLLAISWRNKLTHSFNENDIAPDTRVYLNNHIEDISSEFRNLDIEDTLERFKKSEVPTFKDTASLLSATQKFVADLDSQIVSKLDIKDYVDEILSDHFTKKPQKYNNYQKKDYNARLNILENILKIYSFDEKIKNHELDNLLKGYTEGRYNFIKK